MKKIILVCLLCFSLRGAAQDPISEIIKQAVKKVILAVDLKIQKMQTKTIWLQNAQKTIENAMSKLKLSEINGWVEKQRKLYDDYFKELRSVKMVLSYYHKVRDIIENQVAMVAEYKAAWAVFRQDRQFTPDELEYMADVYTGMMGEALKNLDQLFLVIRAGATQMSDARRMELISQAANQMEAGFLDLKAFNNENKIISIQRASERGDIEYVKRLYGL